MQSFIDALLRSDDPRLALPAGAPANLNCQWAGRVKRPGGLRWLHRAEPGPGRPAAANLKPAVARTVTVPGVTAASAKWPGPGGVYTTYDQS
jgi:hypothetical protein